MTMCQGLFVLCFAGCAEYYVTELFLPCYTRDGTRSGLGNTRGGKGRTDLQACNIGQRRDSMLKILQAVLK
jgi:hypothetical protein